MPKMNHAPTIKRTDSSGFKKGEAKAADEPEHGDWLKIGSFPDDYDCPGNGGFLDEDDYPDHEDVSNDHPSDATPSKSRMLRWSPMRFGDYKGWTLPSIFFANISYVVWLVDHDIIDRRISRKLAEEAVRLLQMAKNIRPPESFRGTHRYAVIVDKQGTFYEFKLFKKGSRSKIVLSPGHKIHSVQKNLDVTVPARCNNERLGFQRMTAQLKQTFLGRREENQTAAAYEKFFNTGPNFGVYDAVFELLGIKPR